MTDAGERTLEREERLYDRLIACLEASGDARDALRAPIEADFPEFAQELREFFDGERMLERFASPLRLSGSVTPSTVWGQAQPEKAAPAAIPSLSDYELVREIARGGMGVVYEARHRILGRLVALKTIRAGERATEEDVRRFEEEARRVAQLDHPDIVPLYEAGHEHGQHYFTMRLMEGGSLADRIAAGKLAPRQAAAVASRVARALHFAHQRGLLHGDVKPANVLFDKDGRAHVGDFGLASQLEPGGAVSRLEAVVGTPMYMAPELVRRDGNLTTGVDVYGLGAVLYELLTGRPPFRARTLLQTLSDLAQRDPERPRQIDPSLDPDLEAICLKCLDKDPRRRYGSAESLADDLDRWLRGEPVKARHCPAWRRAEKWARRSPVVATLGALAVVASAACIAALLVSNFIVTREMKEKSQALEAKTTALAALRHVSYLQGVALADRELQSGSAARAERLLAEQPAGLRGLEWNYLQRLCHAERRSLGGPADPACVVVHPVDGRIYVGGGLLGRPSEVAIFDAALLRELNRFRFNDRVTALAISPDGRRLVAALRGGSGAQVCDASDGTPGAAFSLHDGDVWAVAFSPDGARVVSGGSDGVARIWSAANGREILALPEAGGAIWSVAFSPDGRRIATGSSAKAVQVWDAKSGRRLLTIQGHRGLVRSVAFSPDGRRLVSSAYDNTARVWDAEAGSELATLPGHTSFVTRAVFSPDGRRIATADVDGAVRLWDAATWQQVMLLRGHSGSVWDAAFSRDGRNLASVGQDGAVKLWGATPHGMPRLLDRTDRRIRRIQMSADGRVLAVVYEDGALEVWDTETDRRLCQIGGSHGERSHFGLSGDGRYLAYHDWQALRVTRTIDGTVFRDIAAGNALNLAPALSHDGGYMAVAQMDRLIGVWDVHGGRAIDRVKCPDGDLTQLALAPGGKVLAAAMAAREGGAGRVFLWRRGAAESPVEVAAGSRVALSPGGELLAAFGDTGLVAVCNTASGQREYLLDGMAGPVRSVAFAGPGRLLTGHERGTVTFWDTQAVREILSLRDLTGPVDFLALVRGRAVLGASRDGFARRWEVGPFAGRSGGGELPVAPLPSESEQ